MRTPTYIVRKRLYHHKPLRAIRILSFVPITLLVVVRGKRNNYVIFDWPHVPTTCPSIL
jgi:hypothetical protein